MSGNVICLLQLKIVASMTFNIKEIIFINLHSHTKKVEALGTRISGKMFIIF